MLHLRIATQANLWHGSGNTPLTHADSCRSLLQSPLQNPPQPPSNPTPSGSVHPLSHPMKPRLPFSPIGTLNQPMCGMIVRRIFGRPTRDPQSCPHRDPLQQRIDRAVMAVMPCRLCSVAATDDFHEVNVKFVLNALLQRILNCFAVSPSVAATDTYQSLVLPILLLQQNGFTARTLWKPSFCCCNRMDFTPDAPDGSSYLLLQRASWSHSSVAATG